MIHVIGSVLAGRAVHSSSFFRSDTAALCIPSQANAAVASLQKEGRTLKQTLPSRSIHPTKWPEATSPMRARCCGVRLTPSANVNCSHHCRHVRVGHIRDARERSMALRDGNYVTQSSCAHPGRARPRRRALGGRSEARRADKS